MLLLEHAFECLEQDVVLLVTQILGELLGNDLDRLQSVDEREVFRHDQLEHILVPHQLFELLILHKVGDKDVKALLNGRYEETLVDGDEMVLSQSGHCQDVLVLQMTQGHQEPLLYRHLLPRVCAEQPVLVTLERVEQIAHVVINIDLVVGAVGEFEDHVQVVGIFEDVHVSVADHCPDQQFQGDQFEELLAYLLVVVLYQEVQQRHQEYLHRLLSGERLALEGDFHWKLPVHFRVILLDVVEELTAEELFHALVLVHQLTVF